MWLWCVEAPGRWETISNVANAELYLHTEILGNYKELDAAGQYPVVQILDTSTLSFASMMQPSCRAGEACCRSQGCQASGTVGSGDFDFTKGMDSL